MFPVEGSSITRNTVISRLPDLMMVALPSFQ
jgi:hypothetical protein